MENITVTKGSLSALKKRIQVGVKIKTIKADEWPAIIGVVREVTRVQTNAFTLLTQPEHRTFGHSPKKDEPVHSWVYYQKSDRMAYYPELNQFTIDERIYEFVEG